MLTMLFRRAALLVVASGCVEIPEPLETSTVEQEGVNMQGVNMQGVNMQGVNMQGMTLDGFQFAEATLGGDDLTNLRIVKGELLAERNGVTVRGTQLAGAELVARASNATESTTAEFRISAIIAETSNYDPTSSGNTFLYTVQQYDSSTSTWLAACDADYDGRRVAIPVAAIWDVTGARIESSEMFTFGCTTGVIAKCYRWGYRPWLTGFGGANMEDYHQTCTRLARADYCGIGVPNTRQHTSINVWDRLPAPGPIQKRGGILGLPPLGMLFEAGWNTDGAVCLSTARWLLDDVLNGGSLANLCPEKLVGVGLLGETVCNTLNEVLGQPEASLIMTDAYLNLL
jgi:hypothetical protein